MILILLGNNLCHVRFYRYIYGIVWQTLDLMKDTPIEIVLLGFHTMQFLVVMDRNMSKYFL